MTKQCSSCGGFCGKVCKRESINIKGFVGSGAPVVLAQPEQEPVVTKGEKGLTLHVGWDDLPAGTKLYTSPPQREWVGLTDDEVYKIAFTLEGEHWKKITDAIEAKLKEKNT